MGTVISWVDETWNPVTGCTKLSPGCDNCYAHRIINRLSKSGYAGYEHGFKPDVHENEFGKPAALKGRKRVLVCSMADLFHEAYTDQLIEHLFGIMREHKQHTFCVLTKRPERMAAMGLDFGRNIWAGATVESQGQVGRISELRQIACSVRFLSCEPLLGPIFLPPAHGLSWVICGGENGKNRRPMTTDWARSLRDQCVKTDVRFYFIGPGSYQKEKKCVDLDGHIWDQSPAGVGDQASLF